MAKNRVKSGTWLRNYQPTEQLKTLGRVLKQNNGNITDELLDDAKKVMSRVWGVEAETTAIKQQWDWMVTKQTPKDIKNEEQKTMLRIYKGMYKSL
jgi:hypothetical protein